MHFSLLTQTIFVSKFLLPHIQTVLHIAVKHVANGFIIKLLGSEFLIDFPQQFFFSNKPFFKENSLAPSVIETFPNTARVNITSKVPSQFRTNHSILQTRQTLFRLNSSVVPRRLLSSKFHIRKLIMKLFSRQVGLSGF